MLGKNQPSNAIWGWSQEACEAIRGKCEHCLRDCDHRTEPVDLNRGWSQEACEAIRGKCEHCLRDCEHRN